MLRVIISRKWKSPYSCLETSTFETIDINQPQLETILRGGGYGESGYDYRSVIGVEVLPESEEVAP